MERKSSSTEPPGIDVANITGWLVERAAMEPPLRFEVVTGGRSNLSCKVTSAAGRTLLLRRPPLHGVLGSAHDMAREHRIIAALGPTDVPVPAIVGLCEDESVTGAPFYVMDYVEGVVVREAEAGRELLDERGRRAAGEALVDALVAIHAVDPDSAGLTQHGRKDGYVARQLRRWHGQWEQSKTRELPTVDDVHRRLSELGPEQGAATIVHGDYRLDNVILSPSGEIRAVLDWELSTLGDPLADVGLMLAYWSQLPGVAVPAPATALAGFPTPDEVGVLYGERSGRDVAALDFYIGLGYWKRAVIMEGVYARFAAGAYGETDDSHREFPTLVDRLAEAAEAALDR